ncbi:MAG TPA: kelch repeat-containing protein [Candidatus Limnocylindrales bacterium]
MADGTVLLAGGTDESSSGTLRDQLYDPRADSWTVTGAMVEHRVSHTATRLLDGRVLVTGGSEVSDGRLVASAELYDPATGRWVPTGSMREARGNHTATLLQDGTVLVAGGAADLDGQDVLATAELFDPAKGSWTVLGSIPDARSGHTASLLADGRVLLVGGVGPFVSPIRSAALGSADIYDPATGRWTSANGLAEARFDHTAAVLTDGRVLIAGGSLGFGTALDSVEVFDARTGRWSRGPALIGDRNGHTATELADGGILAVGGVEGDELVAQAEIYDAAANAWRRAGARGGSRQDHAAVLLHDGSVLVAGGTDAGSSPASAVRYHPG